MNIEPSRSHFQEHYTKATNETLPTTAVAKYNRTNFSGFFDSRHEAFLIQLSEQEYMRLRQKLSLAPKYTDFEDRRVPVSSYYDVLEKMKSSKVELILYSDVDFCTSYYISFLSDGKSIIISQFSC